MTERPTYIGVGECGCKRIDVQLYHVPGSLMHSAPVCAKCLLDRGFEVPKPRTAEDIETVDGVPSWRPMPTPPPELARPEGQIDLGHGHLFDVTRDGEGRLIGWLHTHPDARNENGVLCQSFCAVRPLNGAPIHQIVSLDPLTLTPSLKCRACGAHGHVTDGKWKFTNEKLRRL